ncbi:hypothetical protein ABEB36_012859 [Hypothenemus hampei]|uniref:Uncharacterized protein n=1 Tax=Hypothenemus hampei TaxID=57062 RepID=A0ABD1E607_HYPHA
MHTGSLVAKKTQRENCKCSKKCFEKIRGCYDLIFTQFYKLPSKNLQDSYLYGLMKRKFIERKRSRTGSRQSKTSTYIYTVCCNGQVITVCKNNIKYTWHHRK